MCILPWMQTRSHVSSFPNDYIHYAPQSYVFVYMLQHMETQITILLLRDQKWLTREIVCYHWILHSWAFSKENCGACPPSVSILAIEFSSPCCTGLTGVTDVHCITNGRTFHLQKKKVHNKSSDLSSNHPVLPVSQLRVRGKWDFPAARCMRRGVSRAFKIQKEPPPRRFPLEERGWIVSTEGPRRKVGQGKSVRA